MGISVREIKEIILHCSASDVVNYDFYAIKKDHVEKRGWRDIGYHYGIDWDGDIHLRRDVKRPGAHTRGRNTHSIGICVLGLKSFSVIQLEQLGRLVRNICQIFNLSADDVKGHNYYNKNKTCPVFDVEEWKKQFLGEI